MKNIIEPNQFSVSYLSGWETALYNFERWSREQAGASSRLFTEGKRKRKANY